VPTYLCVTTLAEPRKSATIRGYLTPPENDPADPLYVYLNGVGALRPYQQGADDVSHAAISN
jgi:hypothetical protein